MPRRVIVDPRAAPPLQTACCYCAAPLPEPTDRDLRFEKHNLFRCPPVRHPRVALFSCSGCGRLLALYEARGSMVLMYDQAATLKTIRARDRAELAYEVDPEMKWPSR